MPEKCAEPLEVAASQIGYTENPPGSNLTKYGRWYGMNGEPWCMIFVQWCFAQAGKQLPYKTASCSDLLRWYQKNLLGRVSMYGRPNDIVIYRFGHTGIVTSCTDSSVGAIEGNTSAGDQGSQSNGGGVYRRTRSMSVVTAFIHPFDWEVEEYMTGEEIYKALQEYLKTQEIPSWAKEEYQKAISAGITDGTNPMELIPRYQAAIIALRALEKRNG